MLMGGNSANQAVFRHILWKMSGQLDPDFLGLDCSHMKSAAEDSPSRTHCQQQENVMDIHAGVVSW